MEQMDAITTRPRDRRVDLVKTAAICGVLMVHVTVPAFSLGDVGTLPWGIALFWASLSHACVPLFLMASGALMLTPERPMDGKKLYSKNIPRLLIALFFWAACYQLLSLVLWGDLSVPSLIQAGKEVLLFRHEEHLYYLHIMLLVYAFLPITYLVATQASRTQLQYLLGLWFLLGILYPTVRPFWPFSLLTGIPAQWLLNMTYASIGYTLLGRYLAAYHSKGNRRWPWALCALAGLGTGFLGSWFQSRQAGALEIHFLEGMGVPMCLLAVGIYGLCQNSTLPGSLGRLAEDLSRASFCIFLTHIVFLKGLAHFGVNAQMGPAVLTVPLMVLLLLLGGRGVYAVLRRVPVANRYLI